MTEIPENHPDLNRFPVYDAQRPDGVPEGQPDEPEFHIREPYRTSTLSWFTLTLLVIWPLSNLIVTGDPGEMIRQMGSDPATFYISSMIFLWLMFAVVWLTVRRERQTLSSLGFTRPRLLHIVQGLAFFLVSVLILKGLEVILSELGHTPVGELELLLPRTASERIMWVGLSFTAGFCEEAAYRGYFITRIWRLAPDKWSFALRAGLGVALSTITFGLGHTYQGISGFVLISAYGLMIAGLFLYTRSLWPCVTAHFLLDFVNLFLPFYNDQ